MKQDVYILELLDCSGCCNSLYGSPEYHILKVSRKGAQEFFSLTSGVITNIYCPQKLDLQVTLLPRDTVLSSSECHSHGIALITRHGML